MPFWNSIIPHRIGEMIGSSFSLEASFALLAMIAQGTLIGCDDVIRRRRGRVRRNSERLLMMRSWFFE